MDRVTARLFGWATWFHKTVFPRKRGRSPEITEAAESNAEILVQHQHHYHRQKRRRSVSPIQTNPNTDHVGINTVPVETQNELNGITTKSRTPVSSNINSVKKLNSQQMQLRFPRNSNPHRFGRSRLIESKQTQSTAASGPSQPESSIRGVQLPSLRTAPKVPPSLRVHKSRRVGRMDRLELSRIIQESQSCFVKAKNHLMKLEDNEQEKEIIKQPFLNPLRVINVQKCAFRNCSLFPLPSLSDMPPPVELKSHDNWTPFADQKLRVYAEKLRPYLTEIKEENSAFSLLTEDDYTTYSNMESASEDQVFFEFDNCQYTGHDLKTLLPDQWLNDNIINGYMKLLQLRDQKQTSGLSCHFCRSFLINNIFPKYTYSNIRKWTLEKKLRNWGQKKKCILDCDRVFFPVHLGVHWVLVMADLTVKTINYYDSLASQLQPGLQVSPLFIPNPNLLTPSLYWRTLHDT
eukprot:g5803.t1